MPDAPKNLSIYAHVGAICTAHRCTHTTGGRFRDPGERQAHYLRFTAENGRGPGGVHSTRQDEVYSIISPSIELLIQGTYLMSHESETPPMDGVTTLLHPP